MSYIDAGYVIVLSTLTAYGVWLLGRRRHALRSAASVQHRSIEP